MMKKFGFLALFVFTVSECINLRQCSGYHQATSKTIWPIHQSNNVHSVTLRQHIISTNTINNNFSFLNGGCGSKRAGIAGFNRCHVRQRMVRSGEDNGKSKDSNNPPKKRKGPNPILALQRIIVSFFTKLRTFFTNYASRFKRLSKAAKIIVSAQLLCLTLLFGRVTQRSIANYYAPDPSSPHVAHTLRTKPIEIPYSQFMETCRLNSCGAKVGSHPAIKLENVRISPQRIYGRITPDTSQINTDPKLLANDDISTKEINPKNVYANKIPASPELIAFLSSNKVVFSSYSGGQTAALVQRSISSVMILFYMAFLFKMYQNMNGGKSNTPGKWANAASGQPRVKFDDIEGIDNAKYEVMELVDTLRNPTKYAILGARAPTGLLLVGPPGTGKTMLARATATTAGVPLLYCSGSDFVEMFVGRGAARVRSTFERAAKMSPCIIFVDEIDALGKSRNRGGGFAGQFSGNDEAEQTLNQLLACMDGLDSSKGVCVLAATNRREVLDGALTRPGRFDRIIELELPDAKGREKILRVHASKLPGFQEGQGIDDKRLGSLGKGVIIDLSAVAAVTNGLSGAELDFIVNEAAIRAVRRVSGLLREGTDPASIAPIVEARDFEGSVSNFFKTRKGSNGNSSGKVVEDLVNNVFGR